MARTLLWSLGAGPSRVSCGVGRTGDGYLVDICRGETCIDSEVHGTREGAVRRALALEKKHRSIMLDGRASDRPPPRGRMTAGFQPKRDSAPDK